MNAVEKIVFWLAGAIGLLLAADLVISLEALK